MSEDVVANEDITTINTMCLSINSYVHTFYMLLLTYGDRIKQAIRRTLLLPDGNGMAVFSFNKPPKTLRETFVDNFNALTIRRRMKEMILEEKQMCREYNYLIVSNINPGWRSYINLAKMAGAFLIFVSLLVVVVKHFVTMKSMQL